MNIRCVRQFFIGLFCLALCGCATNSPAGVGDNVALMLGMDNHLKSTRVIVGLDPANDVNVFVTPYGSSAQQLGLLGAVVESIVHRSIDAKRQSQERLMLPIRNALIKYNFGGQFRAELERGLQQVRWLNVTYVSKEPGYQRDNVDAILPQVTEDAVLIADAFYGIAPDFSRLTITAHVVIYPRNEMLKNLARRGEELYPLLYRNRFVHEYALEGSYVDAQQAAAKWAEQDGAMVSRALRTGINDIVMRIAADMRT